MLENTRRFKGEVENEKVLAKNFASLGSIFVNEAFSVSHRPHASIVGIPRIIPGYAGFLFADEVSHLSKAFNPPKPFLFILAGAKFETKFPLVKKFLELADTVFLGGALANDLLKAKGYEIGLSKHAFSDLGFAEVGASPKLILPIDVVVEASGVAAIKDVSDVASNEKIVDAGPKTLALLAEKIAAAKFILWNGTLGAYEDGFVGPTEALAGSITSSGAESVVGGGDTLASIAKLNLTDKFSFVSTGGGAMLDFLANGTLPGITALEQ
jgi:phosphoglycerate kinase